MSGTYQGLPLAPQDQPQQQPNPELNGYGAVLMQGNNPSARQAIPLSQPAAPAPQPAAAQPAQAAPPPAAPQQAQPAQPQQAQSAQPQQAQPAQQQQPGAVAQSEPATTVRKPIIDPRPYAWLAKNDPQKQGMVDQVAQETGVSPQRLAAHWYVESGFRMSPPDGGAGEVGPMQVLPSTAQMYNKQGVLDPHNPMDNLLLAGRYINQLDAKFGKDSYSSIAGYQSGPGGPEDVANNPQNLAKHPNMVAYVHRIAPGAPVSASDFTGGGSMTAPGLVQAATQGGPDGYLRYAVSSAPRGMSMTDVQRQAEATLVGFFASRGDAVGMQHARDFALQQAHTGSNQYLQAAYQSLNAGDPTSAAQALAKAHAFFPDGTMGKFGVDSKGQVWGERVDENDPTHVLSTFQVKPQDIGNLFNQTSNPQQFLQTLTQQREAVANERYRNNMGDYYANLIPSRERIAAEHDQASANNTNMRTNTQLTVADERASRQGVGPASKLSATADSEADKKFNDLTMPNTTPVERGQTAAVYHDVRMQGYSPPEAEAVARGLGDHTLQLLRLQDGNYGVISKGGQQPIAYVSKSMGDRLGGFQPQRGPQPGLPGVSQANASPIGAGASSPYARGAGVNSNLTGTTMPQPPQEAPVAQSSAIPVGAPQQ